MGHPRPGPWLWIEDHMLESRGWDEVCWPVPGRIFFHDPQSLSERPNAMAEEGHGGRHVYDGVTMITRSGRGEGATDPGPCCRNPLKHNRLCGALCVCVDTGQSVACHRVVYLGRFCRRPSFAAPSSSKPITSSGRVRRGGLAVWLATLVVRPMLCQVQISYSSQMRCAISPRSHQPQISGGRPSTTPGDRSCSTGSL